MARYKNALFKGWCQFLCSFHFFLNVKTFYLNYNISSCVYVSGDTEKALAFYVSAYAVVEFVPLNIFYGSVCRKWKKVQSWMYVRDLFPSAAKAL